MRTGISTIQQLTLRDRAILESLTHRVRVLSLNQIAQTWWLGSDRSRGASAARSRMVVLEQRGLIHRLRMLAHPLLELRAPVVRWRRKVTPPEFESLAYRLQCRWNQPNVLTTGFIASAAAAELFAGCADRYPRQSEYTHDLHLAQVYLRYLNHRPGAAETWVSEAMTLRRRDHRDGALPDASVADAPGSRVRRAVEFGGAYSAQKLEAFHAACSKCRMPYEIW